MIRDITFDRPVTIPSSGVYLTPTDGSLFLFSDDQDVDSTPPDNTSGVAITVKGGSLHFTTDGTEAVATECHELPAGSYSREMSKVQLLLVKGVMDPGGSFYVEFIRRGSPGE